MKKLTKVLAIVLVFAMVAALGLTAFAAEISRNIPEDEDNASITVNLPSVPEGAGDYTANNTYTIYKVFDAQNNGEDEAITYTLVNGKTTVPAGFTVDENGRVTYTGAGENGELTAADIAAIASYVTAADVVATVATTSADSSFTVDKLPYGYYYITTTTGTVVTVDSTNPNATVDDKNEIPPVDKKITGATSYDEDGLKAMAEVGSTVEFSVTITKKKGAENYEFHDKMDAGLAYNGDVKVFVGGQEVPAVRTYYTVGADEGDTLTVRFENSYINSLPDETVITLTYTATVTSDALQTDPAKNTAWLTFGDVNGENSTPKKEVEVYNAKISITKTDDKDKPLKDAGFVLKNSDNKYFKLVDGKATWVDDIADADEHFSDAEGKVPAFAGLANGTYTLVEKTIPGGYNKADDKTFTIADGDYTEANLIQSATVVNQGGPVLPSTGGIGTTIIYIIGAMLVLGAGVVLVARRRVRA